MATFFEERKIFFKISKSTLLRYPVGRKFRRNRSISHSLRDTYIYDFCNVAITHEVKAITINNTKQATDPINFHTKFYKDELNMFPLKEDINFKKLLKVAK